MCRKMLSPLCFFSVLFIAIICFFIYPTDISSARGSGTFTVVSPGNGNVWEVGSQQTIRWNYSGVPDSKATVTLFKGGKSVIHIKSSTAIGSDGSGSYTWTIPSTLKEGSDYQIKVLSSKCPDGGWSGHFTIRSGGSTGADPSGSTQQTTTQTETASFTVISPGAGVVWTAGSQQNVRWNYSGLSDSKATITLLKGGKSVIHIASSTAIGSDGSGTYAWAIPSYLKEGSDYQIKVLSSKCPDGGWSGYFTIGSGSSVGTGTSGSTQQTGSGQSGDIRVFLNGRQLYFDQPPVIIEGSTLVPMRAIFEALGAVISWDAASQTVTGVKGDTTITLVIGRQTALINGRETALSQPSQLIGGRTMVPLRFVAEALNAEVSWDGTTRTITITLDNTVTPPGNDGEMLQRTGAKSVIEKFFNLVERGDIGSALTLLDAEALGDDASQELWKSGLGTINSASITSIEESNKAEWPDNFEQYKVVVSIHLKPGSQTLWSEGLETRWISLVRVNGQWKILEIATG